MSKISLHIGHETTGQDKVTEPVEGPSRSLVSRSQKIFSCQIQLAASVVNQHFEVVEEVVAYHALGA